MDGLDAFVTSTLPQKRQVEDNVNKEKSARLENTAVFISILALQSQNRKVLSIRNVAVLATESMLPSKQKRHLTNHSNLYGKPRKFFPFKLSEMNKQSVLLSILYTHLPRHSLRLLKLHTELQNAKNSYY